MHTKDGEVSSFSYGMGCMKFVEKTLKADYYKQMLKNGLLPTIEDQYLEANDIFQQDLVPCYKSKSSKKWLTERNIKILPWQAYSPDFNPYENDIIKAIRNEKVVSSTKTERILSSHVFGIIFRKIQSIN